MENVSRRDALRGLAVTVGALTAASVVPGGLFDAPGVFAASPTPTTSLTPDQAIARLAAGNRRFVQGKLRHPRREGPRRARVAEGQAPFAVVLGCADSRVPPEIIYDEGLGNLFVVRIVGNTATDPYVLGSVEYGSAELGAVAIVVLGHEGCGAVKAAIDVAQNGTQLPGDIGAFVAPIVPIAAAAHPDDPEGRTRPGRDVGEHPPGRHDLAAERVCSPTPSPPTSSGSSVASTSCDRARCSPSDRYPARPSCAARRRARTSRPGPRCTGGGGTGI